MAKSTEPSPPLNPDLQVAMPDVVKFVRQLAHDLRNDLNAAELQSAYLAEITDSEEVKDEIKRLRAMIAVVASNLQKVTAALAQPKLSPMSYDAGDFLEDLRLKLGAAHPEKASKVEWKVEGNATLEIDPQLLLPAIIELFENAFRHGSDQGVISVDAGVQDQGFVFTIHEPKSGFARSTENWGREPFRSIGHGHYGLGLCRTRAVVEAHRGQLHATYDSATSSLVTTVSLPVGSAG